MAGPITTLLEARGWLRVDRVGRMLTAECGEPAVAYLGRADGRVERGSARRVCLYEDHPTAPATGGQSREARSPYVRSGDQRSRDEDTVRRLLGWDGDEALVISVAGEVRRTGLAYCTGPGQRVFVLSLASRPSPSRAAAGWASDAEEAQLVLLVSLDRSPHCPASELLAGVAREARGTAADRRIGLAGGGLSVILVHPCRPSADARSDDATWDERAAAERRALATAVREATADALAAAGWAPAGRRSAAS